MSNEKLHWSWSIVTVQIRYLEIWMIRIVEEIELLLLLNNRLFMTSQKLLLFRRIQVNIFVTMLVTW
jgi:hypothetical protein